MFSLGILIVSVSVAGINGHFKTIGRIVGISQDYKVIEKYAMTAHMRTAVYANFKHIFKAQEIRRKKKLSRRSIIESEKKEY